MRNWFLLGVIALVFFGISRLFSADTPSPIQVNVNSAKAVYWDGQPLAIPEAKHPSKGDNAPPATIEYQGNLYVPLSMVGEWLDKPVGWDPHTSMAWVGQAPAAPAAPAADAGAVAIKPAVPPQTAPSEPVAVAASASTSNLPAAPKAAAPAEADTDYHLFGIKLGMSAQQVKSILGEPNRTEPSSLGYQWWVYNKDLSKYLQIGIAGDQVVDLYSNAPTAKLGGTGIGASLKSLTSKHSLQNVVSFSYKGANIQITNQKQQRPLILKDGTPLIFYLDKQNSDKVTALRMINTQMLLRGGFYETKWTYTGKAPNFDPPPLTIKQRELVNAANERQLLDLVNVVRYRYKLPALSWHEGAAEVARQHSQDMMTNDFFDHISATTGLDPFARLKQANIRYTMAGENIAAGYPDAIEAHESWMNSPGHRKNVLEKGFMQLGVGVVTDYFTQAFLTLPK